MKYYDARKSDTFVVYDKRGMLSAPRAYWMLKSFGVQSVRILDGTFSRWETDGYEIERGEKESAFRRLDRKTKPKADDFDYKRDVSRNILFDEI